MEKPRELKKRKKKSKARGDVGASQGKLSMSDGYLHLKGRKRKRKHVKDGSRERKDETGSGNLDFDGDGDGLDGSEFVIGELPRVLFDSEKIPSRGRINAYSRIDLLREITAVLHGTKEYEWLIDSVFGKLFSLPTRHCEFSGKLVHQLLCRSLITDKKHEMWFLFGGKPIRYSLTEFAMITGLNCNPLPSKDEQRSLKEPAKGEKWYWETLIGHVPTMSVAQLVRKLKADMVETRPGKKLSQTKKLQMCLVILVDGVLVNSSSTFKAKRSTVEMVKNIEEFCNYPWGRESFELSMRMVKVGKKVKDVEALAMKMYQSHISNHGFTMAFHLLAIYAIPMLEAIIPVSETDSYFTDPKFQAITKLHPFHNDNILAIEKDPGVWLKT